MLVPEVLQKDPVCGGRKANIFIFFDTLLGTAKWECALLPIVIWW